MYILMSYKNTVKREVYFRNLDSSELNEGLNPVASVTGKRTGLAMLFIGTYNTSDVVVTGQLVYYDSEGNLVPITYSTASQYETSRKYSSYIPVMIEEGLQYVTVLTAASNVTLSNGFVSLVYM